MDKDVQLKKDIAEFYDKFSGRWEDIHGGHIHSGFYDSGAAPAAFLGPADHHAAQIRMIEEALRFAGVSSPSHIVDVGCGIGGTSRYLAATYGATCKGITLSPVQSDRANALAAAQGLSNKASFQVADAMNMPFPDNHFELVWSLESAEHMPDKARFAAELARVAAPGASIVILAWCCRDLAPHDESLQPWEQDLLAKTTKSLYWAGLCSSSDYVRLLQSLHLEDINAADWTQHIAPFLPGILSSCFTWKGFTSLLLSGWTQIRAWLALRSLAKGYDKGLIKYAIITCRKPHCQQ